MEKGVITLKLVCGFNIRSDEELNIYLPHSNANAINIFFYFWISWKIEMHGTVFRCSLKTSSVDYCDKILETLQLIIVIKTWKLFSWLLQYSRSGMGSQLGPLEEHIAQELPKGVRNECLKARLHWAFLERNSWLKNSDRLLVNLLSRRIGNRNFPVTVINRALKRLNINWPLAPFARVATTRVLRC